jgi:putative DNA primase/helicase
LSKKHTKHFEILAAAGYTKFLLPIIPPGATISEVSNISPNNCGKIPGKYLGDDKWCGFVAWSRHETTGADLKEWRNWPGVGVGIKCGLIVGADIDVTDETLALAVEKAAVEILGPAPCRIGNPPKRLLPYKIKRAIKKTRDEYIDEVTGEIHAVEILGEGQQFVAEAIHPKTGAPYTWNNGSLAEVGFNGLSEIDPAQLDEFRKEVRILMEKAGFVVKQSVSSRSPHGVKRLPIGDPSLMGEPELVGQALEVIGNAFRYDEWIKYAVAIKAALGGNEEAYKIYEKWCFLWPENTAEIARQKWDSFQDANIGAQFLFDRARDAGCSLPETGAVDSHGNPILEPSKPMEIAKRIVEDLYSVAGTRILHRLTGVFYHWNSTHYPEASDDTVRAEIYWYLDKAKKKTVKGNIVPFNPTQADVNKVIDALKAVVHLPDDTTAPTWLDKRENPPASDILVCRNGLLNILSRELLPHNPDFFSHNSLSFSFDAKAPEPAEFMKFLDSVWGHDPEAISCLQEFMGYFVSGNTHLQKILLMVGPKRSGKGTLARVIEKLLGGTNVCSPTLGSFSSGFPLQPLLGKLLAIISDARLGSQTDQKAITENLLRISGEDAVNVSRKFLTDWSGHLPTRFMIITNELPRLADASGALASRFHPLVMTKSFFGKENLKLSDRLLEELPGILNWSLDGWERLKKRKYFILPKSSKESLAELEELSSPVSAFITDECIVGPKQSISVDEIYRRWQEWCRDQGRNYSVPKATFGRDLHAALPEIRKTRPRKNARFRVWMYEGIGLKPSKEAEGAELLAAEDNIINLARGKRTRRT